MFYRSILKHVGCFNHLVRWLHAHMDLTYLAGKIQYFEWVRVASPSHLTSSLGGMTAAMPQNPAFRWPARGHHNSRRDRKTSKPYETLADSISYVVKISRYGHPPLFVILFVWNPVFGCLVDPGPRRELCAFWNATELATSWTTFLPSSIFGGCWRPALLTHTQFRDMIEELRSFRIPRTPKTCEFWEKQIRYWYSSLYFTIGESHIWCFSLPPRPFEPEGPPQKSQGAVGARGVWGSAGETWVDYLGFLGCTGHMAGVVLQCTSIYGHLQLHINPNQCTTCNHESLRNLQQCWISNEKNHQESKHDPLHFTRCSKQTQSCLYMFVAAFVGARSIQLAGSAQLSHWILGWSPLT